MATELAPHEVDLTRVSSADEDYLNGRERRYDQAQAHPVAGLILAALHEQDATTYNGLSGDMGGLALDTASKIAKIEVFVLTYTDLGQYQGAAAFEGVFSTRKKAWKEAAQMIRKHGLDARGFYIAEVEIR